MTFIDLTSYRCPLALVKLKLALKQRSDGEQLLGSLADKGSRQDAPRFLTRQGYLYTEQQNNDQVLVLAVVKTARS